MACDPRVKQRLCVPFVIPFLSSPVLTCTYLSSPLLRFLFTLFIILPSPLTLVFPYSVFPFAFLCVSLLIFLPFLPFLHSLLLRHSSRRFLVLIIPLPLFFASALFLLSLFLLFLVLSSFFHLFFLFPPSPLHNSVSLLLFVISSSSISYFST